MAHSAPERLLYLVLSLLFVSFGVSATFSGCGRHEWMCDGGQCIAGSYICDGDEDCPGGEDESRALCGNCTANSFYCLSSRRCISYLFMCDGTVNCLKAEDEDGDRCFDAPSRQDGVSCNATALSIRVRAQSADERCFVYNSACSLFNNGRSHEGTFSLSECGMSKRTENTTVIYYAYLATVSEPNAEVVDDGDSLRLVECRYKANVTKTRPVSFEAVVNGTAGRAPITGSPSSNVTGISMRQFPSPAFDTPYNESAYPLSLRLGATTYVQVKALGEVVAIQLALKSCRAYSNGGRAQHQLLRDGCVASRLFTFLPSPSSSELRFAIKAFSLVGGSGPVFVECEVGICDKGNDGCGGCSEASRLKRSLAYGSQMQHTYRATLGPMEVSHV